MVRSAWGISRPPFGRSTPGQDGAAAILSRLRFHLKAGGAGSFRLRMGEDA